MIKSLQDIIASAVPSYFEVELSKWVVSWSGQAIVCGRSINWSQIRLTCLSQLLFIRHLYIISIFITDESFKVCHIWDYNMVEIRLVVVIKVINLWLLLFLDHNTRNSKIILRICLIVLLKSLNKLYFHQYSMKKRIEIN